MSDLCWPCHPRSTQDYRDVFVAVHCLDIVLDLVLDRFLELVAICILSILPLATSYLNSFLSVSWNLSSFVFLSSLSSCFATTPLGIRHPGSNPRATAPLPWTYHRATDHVRGLTTAPRHFAVDLPVTLGREGGKGHEAPPHRPKAP